MEGTLVNFETFKAISLAEQVKKLCQPMFYHLNIGFFYMQRAYPDQKRMLLCSSAEWIKDYFVEKHYENELANFPETLEVNKLKTSIWVACEDTSHKACMFWEKMKKKHALSSHLYFIYPFEDYLEIFGFALKQNSPHVTQSFLFNVDIYKHFCHYFLDAGQGLISQVEKQKFTVPPRKSSTYTNISLFGLDESIKKQLYDQTKVKHIYLNGKHQHVKLTPEEARTLLLACEAYKYSQIAEILSVSEHTIKYRMNNVREKMQIKRKGDLIRIFLDNHYHILCKDALGYS